MIKHLTISFFVFWGFSSFAQISGPTSPNTNTTYAYTFNNGNLILGGISWQATNGTIHSSTGPSGTTYTATISFSSTGSKTITAKHPYSGATLATLNVNVLASLNPGSIGNAQTVCYNGNPSAISNTSSASGGSGGISYQWQSKCFLTACGWTNVSGATSSTFDPPSLASTTHYRRRATSGGVTEYTNQITITVRKTLVAGSIGNAQTLCYDGDPSPLTNTSSPTEGNGSYTYQWQISTNGTSGWNNVGGATSSTYNPGALTSSRWYRRRVSSCAETKYSNTVKVTIRPNLVPGSIGNAQTLAYNGNPSRLTNTASASGGYGGISYQWQQSTNGTSGWGNIGGANGTTYDPGALTASRWYRRRAISCGQTKYTNKIKITINPPLAGGTISNAQTICYNADPSTITNSASASGGNGSYSYQWQSRCQIAPAGSSCNWINITGETGTSFNPPNLSANTLYRRRVISEGVSRYSNEITITVRPTLNPGGIGNNQTLCYNGNPSTLSNASSPSGGNGSYSYQWQQSTNGTSGWNNVSGATSSTYDPGALTSSRWFRRQVVSCGETKYTSFVKVTIRPDLVPGSIGNPQTLSYNGDPVSLSNNGSASGGTGNITYQWQHSNNGSSGWGNIGGATSSTYNPPPLTANKWYRRRAYSCSEYKYTNTVKITINPQLQPGSIGNEQTICYNTDPASISNTGSASGGDGTRSYQWQERCLIAPIGSSCNWEDIAGATSSTYNPPNLTFTRVYRRVVRSEGISKLSNEITVFVKPELQAGDIGNSQTVCYSGNPSAFLNESSPLGGSGTGTYSYQWQQSANGTSGWTNVGGATNATYDPGPLTTTRWYRRSVTSCEQTKYTDAIRVTVRPSLIAGEIGNNQVIPYNTNAGSITNTSSASGGNGSIFYQWEKRTGSAEWDVIENIDAASYNPDFLTETTEYRRIAISCNQTLYSNTVTVSVNPELIGGTIQNNFTVCYNGSSASISNQPASGGDQTYSYQWEQKCLIASIGSPCEWEVIFGETSENYSPSNLTVSTMFRRKAISEGIEKYSNEMTIFVNPSLTAGITNGSQTVCYDEDPAILGSTAPATGGDGGLDYQWEERNPGGTWSEIDGAIYETYDPPILTATKEFQRRASSCNDTQYAEKQVVTVRDPLVSGTIGSTQIICSSDDPAELVGQLASGGDYSYQYQWEWRPEGGSWSEIAGATNANYDPGPGSLSTTTEFQRRVTSCGQTEYSNTEIVYVNLPVSPGSIGGSQTVCYNGGGSLTFGAAPSGGIGQFTYFWEEKPEGGSWQPIFGELNAELSFDSLTVNTEFRRRARSCNVNSDPSNVVLVIVQDQLQPGSISGNQEVCLGGPADQPLTIDLNPTGGDDSYEYQWEYKCPLVSCDWDDVDGETSESFTPSEINSESWYRLKVTSCGQEATTDHVVITIRSGLQAGTITGTQTVCFNGSASQPLAVDVPASGGYNGYTYQWQYKCPLVSCDWQDIGGATSESYTPAGVTAESLYRLKVMSCAEEEYTNTVFIRPIQGSGFAGYITGDDYLPNTSTPGSLTLATTSGSITWYSSTDGETWNMLSGATSTYSYDSLSEDTYFRAEVSSSSCMSHSDPFLVQVNKDNSSLNVAQYNYVKTTVLLTEETNTQNISNLSAAEKAISVKYTDGLGRTVQQVSEGATPGGNNLVSFIEYEAEGLEKVSYLPYATGVVPLITENGYYVNAKEDQSTYYASHAPTGTESSAAPYAVTKYDASPRKLIKEQGAPGTDWQPGNGHTVQYDYRFNTLGEVLRYSATDLTPLADYAANTLNRAEITDENGHKVVTFTNKRGQTVLKKVEQSAGVYASTVNVYDEVGKLRFVLSPNATAYIASNPSWNLADLRDQEDLIFEYRYDNQGRLTERKVPGKGWEFIVYDPLDRIALTQDAIMREKGQWSFTKVDRRGRPVYTGLYIDGSTRAQLQSTVDTLDYDGGTDAFYEGKGSAVEGYTNDVFPTTNIEVQTVNFYDDYDYQSDWGMGPRGFSNPDERQASGMNGNSQYIALDQFYNQANSIDQLTIEAWVNTSFVGSQWDNWAIIDFDRSEFYNLFVHGGNGKVGFSTKGENINDFYSNQSINDGEWHHVAAVFDGNDKYIYIDGEFDNKITNPHGGTLLGTPNTRYGFIGDGSEATSFNGKRNKKYFQGKIGEVRLWHRVRTPQEIAEHIDVPISGNEVGLIGKWSMSNVGSQVEDETGNGNTGTNFNGVTQESDIKQGGSELYMHENPRGFLTGSMMKVGSDWQYSVNYYDDKYRTIQVISSNHLDGEEVNTIYYDDYTSRPERTIQLVDASDEVVQITRRFEYDPRGRMINSWHQINNRAEVLLSNNTYSELNQLIEKNIGNNMQSIDYNYNIRGWLKGINNADLSDGEGDLFGMELSYNTASTGLGNTTQFNGNISATKWSHYDTESDGITERGYAYNYDHADRLEAADQRKNTGSWNTSAGFDIANTQYDPNGNLQSLSRQGESSANVDDLTYSYQGNQLLSVSDNSTLDGFSDGSNTGDDYIYDVNGNLIKDLNKGIDTIYYNHLDLPIKVVLSGEEETPDSLTYLYTATGTKLGMRVWKDDSLAGRVDYLGNFRFEDGKLHSIMHEEGRVMYHEEATQAYKYDYQYNLRDHQGNTRRVLSSLPEVYTTVEDFEDETSGFSELNTHTSNSANTTIGGSQVSLLSSGQNGALVMYQMDKGDTIDLKVNANYETAPSSNTFANTAYGALFGQWNASLGSGTEAGGGSSQTDGAFDQAFFAMDSLDKGENTAPRAFLNYIIFDTEMNYITSGFQQISAASGEHESVEISDIIADRSSYILAYLSNENQDSLGVHFDDFTVRHSKTNVVQSVDYYPFGMEAMSYTRTAADPTKYLYNGGVEKNKYTSYYETFYRNYDASIGRFTGVDIKAAQFTSQTPYQYAFNDPVTFNDPLGDEPMGDLYGGNSLWQDRAESGFGRVDGRMGRWQGPSFYYGPGYGEGSVGSMTSFAMNNTADGTNRSFVYNNGSYQGSFAIDDSPFDWRNDESAVNRDEYWTYGGGTTISNTKLIGSYSSYTVSTAKAAFNMTGFLGDLLNSRGFGDYSIQNSESIWTRLWHSPIARKLIPDVLSVDLSAGASFGIGNSFGRSVNLITRGPDAGIHHAITIIQANMSDQWRYGLDIDAGINFGSLDFTIDPSRIRAGMLEGYTHTTSAGFVVGGNYNISFANDGRVLYQGFSFGIGETVGISQGKSVTKLIKNED